MDGLTVLATAPLNASGTATYSTSALTPGIHSITAVYGGDTRNAGSTSPVWNETVNAAHWTTATTLTASPNPATVGSSVTFTAVTTGGMSAGGTVTFQDGSTVLGSAVLLGSGPVTRFSTSRLSVGSHSITAVYSGDAANSGSTSPVWTEIVTAPSVPVSPTLTVTPSATSIMQQDSLSFSFTLVGANGEPTPSGTLSYSVPFNGGNYGGGSLTVPGNGFNAVYHGNVSPGSYTLQANYTPDTASTPYYTSASATAQFTVDAAQAQAGLYVGDAYINGATTTTPMIYAILPDGEVFLTSRNLTYFGAGQGWVRRSEHWSG